jgi:RNA polymerase sigma-70 factor (ECF subfamily)
MNELVAEPLRRAHQEGTRAWPNVALAFDRFAAHATAIGAGDDHLRQNGSELYLAVACLEGDPTALAFFDSTYLREIERLVARFNLTGPQVDELKQALRIRLFSGPQPRIGRYAAQAPLRAWLRIVASRLALDMVEEAGEHRRAAGPSSVLEVLMANADPEWLASKRDVQAAFQTALEESLADLDARQLLLLRMHFLDGLGLDEMSRVFRVHRSSIARWLAAARASVFEGVRQRLSLKRTPTTASEFRSLVRLVQSDLHLSLERVLGPRP